MKKTALLISMMALLCSAAGAENPVKIETASSCIILDAENDKELTTLYFGAPVNPSEVISDKITDIAAYPVYGHGNIDDYALSVTHGDGNMTLDMVVESVEQNTSDEGSLTRIRMKDKLYPFYCTVCYRTYQDSDIIECWTEIENQESKTVKLRRFDSFSLPIRMGDVWCSSMYGSWADECRIMEQPIPFGTFSIENRNGIRNSNTSHSEVMISLDGKPQENSGRVIGAALCYSGNYQLRFCSNLDRNSHNVTYHMFYAGIHPDDSEYPLASKETFVTPKLALSYSEEGLGGISRRFHDWARSHRMVHGNDCRMVLLNSWEGVYFDINEPKMEQMMKDIKAIGGELFVMDDGWFGQGEFRRVEDKTGLGDWTVDKVKLPHGIPWLVSKAKENGIKFGIWVESEMANTKSDLYTKHPDWIINAPGRDVLCGRGGSQVVLDLGNPAVQEHVFQVIDNLMNENPDIAYFKWDSNMRVLSHGASRLTGSDQSRLYIDYHRGLEAVCQRIRAKYPDLIIQCCASGGARVNYSMTPYFDEFWTSDNTDALQRIFMQWGTSYFFPSMVMAAHISDSPNHQTGRLVPLKFRIDVAMSGRLGLELQPAKMSKEDYDLCKRAVSDYKSVRETVQFGDLYRLLSPYENKGAASLMYVSKDKNEAVFYEWKLEHFTSQILPRIKMEGLDPHKNYTVTELVPTPGRKFAFEGKVFSGEYLMKNGLETINYKCNPTPDGHQNGYCSCVLKLEAN